MTTSEFRSYGFILDSLAALGWNRQPPSKGGQVYTQNEVSRDVGLKSVLGSSVQRTSLWWTTIPNGIG